MSANSAFQISVFPGDGIGREVMTPTIEILRLLQERIGGFDLRFQEEAAGAAHYKETGTALPEEAMTRASATDAILLGAMGMPDIRYPDGREIAPQLDMREQFELFAGVRPVRTLPGTPVPLADPRAQSLDFVLIRESTEGLFAGRGKTRFDGPADRPSAAHDTMTLTRKGSERLFDFAFKLASRRRDRGHRGEVTCIDKANVIGGFYFFRQIFDEVAGRHPDLTSGHMYVDACALNMVRQPWMFDVLATENMFGDILSDLGAGLMGGMGMAPSADIGERHAVFQPCHGSAPDIAGRGLANPTATFLSAAMMLDWLGDQHSIADCGKAGRVLDSAVSCAFVDSALKPTELGGTDGTASITAAVMDAITSGKAERAADSA
ncbi:isocitrate/isopropylmalate family dehydrogenase [Thalassobaculum sp.]|uniref:isocitrate/isopropylmalate dehydrogenase family protein n=1 Tax=Thalassobaculum sp. TaxID=2022740 RepID=UPI0032EFCFDB